MTYVGHNSDDFVLVGVESTRHSVFECAGSVPSPPCIYCCNTNAWDIGKYLIFSVHAHTQTLTDAIKLSALDGGDQYFKQIVSGANNAEHVTPRCWEPHPRTCACSRCDRKRK